MLIIHPSLPRKKSSKEYWCTAAHTGPVFCASEKVKGNWCCYWTFDLPFLHSSFFLRLCSASTALFITSIHPSIHSLTHTHTHTHAHTFIPLHPRTHTHTHKLTPHALFFVCEPITLLVLYRWYSTLPYLPTCQPFNDLLLYSTTLHHHHHHSHSPLLLPTLTTTVTLRPGVNRFPLICYRKNLVSFLLPTLTHATPFRRLLSTFPLVSPTHFPVHAPSKLLSIPLRWSVHLGAINNGYSCFF